MREKWLAVACAALLYSSSIALAQVGSQSADPLSAELQRCKELREAAATDARCAAAYRQNRDHFFGASDRYEPKPIDMFPKTPDRPLAQPKN